LGVEAELGGEHHVVPRDMSDAEDAFATGGGMLGDLTDRRAFFVYEAARIQAISARAPVVPELWDLRESEFRAQFREVIERQMGEMRSGSPAELHGGWVQAYIDMGWKYGPVRDVEAKTHPDMVPFDRLEQREQDKDAVFIALCEIARLWIREEP
jgi:RyR domain